jgi:hypothetical protein
MDGRGEVHLQDILKFIRRRGSFRLHLFECLSARVPFTLLSASILLRLFDMSTYHCISFLLWSLINLKL